MSGSNMRHTGASIDVSIEVFKGKLFAAAKEKGFSDYEVYYTGGSSFSVKVFQGEIREYKNAGNTGLSFRGTWKGKMGYAFTERVDDDVIPFLVENAAQNAEIISNPDAEDLFAGSPDYPQVKTWDETLAALESSPKIEKALDIEKAALAFDKRVESVDYCQLGTDESKRYIANSLGLNVCERGNSAYAYTSSRVRGEDGQVKTGFEVWVGKNLAGMDAENLGKRASEKALSYLGAKSVPPGTYTILLDNNAASDLLSAFSGVFSADEAQKGFSLLKGKLGEQIAADCVDLRDDPLLDQLPGSCSFDAEGVAARNKFVIERGVLKIFLHNRKTAKKDGVESTGNGFKPSFKAAVGVAPANFYFVPSDKTQEALVTRMGSGLLITELEGLHSGTNAVSGDFSVSAGGYLVEGGKKTRAVEQITVAGNFFTLLKDILAVGSDLEFKSNISSPSLLIKGLSVSGL